MPNIKFSGTIKNRYTYLVFGEIEDMNPKELQEKLEQYLRLESFPLGFKFVKSEEELPEKFRRADDLTICQAYNISRRYGWTMFFDRNTTCPIGLVAYGFTKPDELYESGELAYDAGYAINREIGRKFEEAIVKLNESYLGCLVAPLRRMERVDFVVVYGNPAQILRLVHATLYDVGGAFETRILGRGACTEFLEAFVHKKPRLVLPCYGDRLFGLTQDHEIAFAFPFEMSEKIVRNLEETHRRGIRYPIPTTALRLKLILPESYEKSAENMKK